MRRTMSGLVLLCLLGSTLAAQNKPGTPFCVLRARPLPACKSFLVLEAAVELPFASSTTDIIPAFSTQAQKTRDYDTRFTVSVGGMVNQGNSSAVGGTLGFVLGRSSIELPARAELRYRQWRGKTAVDFSAGPARQGIASRYGGDVTTAYGGTAAVGVEYGLVGADMRVDLLRAEGRTLAGGFLGAKATSAGAPVAATLATLALFILVASVGN